MVAFAHCWLVQEVVLRKGRIDGVVFASATVAYRILIFTNRKRRAFIGRLAFFEFILVTDGKLLE